MKEYSNIAEYFTIRLGSISILQGRISIVRGMVSIRELKGRFQYSKRDLNNFLGGKLKENPDRELIPDVNGVRFRSTAHYKA